MRDHSRIFVRGTFAWVALIGVPLLISRSSEFLGQDVSAIALGIIGFYPWIALGQVAIIGLLSFILTMIVSLSVYLLFPKIKFLAHVMLVFSYFLASFFLASIKYPAYFSDFIPEVFDRYIWLAADYLNPSKLHDFFLLFPIVVLCMRAVYHMSKVIRPRFIGGFGVLLIAMSLIFFTVERGRPQPTSVYSDRQNILVIGIDSLRADAVSQEITPNIWSLKNDPNSVSFEDHLIGIPRTFPSWMEILTGQYASQTGIRHMFPSFNIRERKLETLGSFFKNLGLKTLVVSDFAGDIFPRFRGGFEEVHTPNLKITDIIKLNVTQQFRLFMPFFLAFSNIEFFSIFRQNPALADPKIITDIFLREISNKSPWMGLLFYSTAHFPYAAPYPFYKKFVDSDYGGKFFFKKNPEVKITGNKIDSANKKQIKSLYDGAVSSVDQEVGRLLEELKKNDLWENTVIILTADHGEQIFDDDILQGHGEHLRGEWVIKVPLIIKIPDSQRVMMNRVDSVSQSVDIFPTLLGILGKSIPEKVSGIDFSPYIFGKDSNAPRDVAYSETGIWFSRAGEAHFQKNRLDYPGISGLLEFDVGRSDEIVLNRKFESIVTIAKHRAIMNSHYKLIYQPTLEGPRYELFDRINDPTNETNLIKIRPDVFSYLRLELKKHVQQYDRDFEVHSELFVPQDFRSF